MTTVDPASVQSWRMLAERVDAEADPRRRTMLATVARHVEAEVLGDIETLLETLVDEPTYRFWGSAGLDGPKGKDAVVGHYQMLIEGGINRLEFEVVRVLVDDSAVVTEGWFRHAYSGAMVQMFSPGEAVDPSAWYLVEYLALVVWPFEGDLITGEDIFFGTNPRMVRALAPGEMSHLGPRGRL